MKFYTVEPKYRKNTVCEDICPCPWVKNEVGDAGAATKLLQPLFTPKKKVKKSSKRSVKGSFCMISRMISQLIHGSPNSGELRIPENSSFFVRR